MKIKFKEKKEIESEIEICFPCFRKNEDGNQFVAILSEKRTVEVVLYKSLNPSFYQWNDKPTTIARIGECSLESNEAEFMAAIEQAKKDSIRFANDFNKMVDEGVEGMKKYIEKEVVQ